MESSKDVSKWIAIVSAAVTVGLSIANAYWSHRISLVDQDLKIRETSLMEQQFQLDVGKGKLDRYAFVQRLLDGALSQDAGQRTITVNLITLTLGSEEAAQLFAGLRASENETVREVAAAGTELVNQRFRIFLHLGKHDASGIQPLDPVKDALNKAGFEIRGSDNELDRHGPGIDYFNDTDRAGAERVATILNGLRGPKDKPFIVRRQSTKNAQGTLGVWY